MSLDIEHHTHQRPQKITRQFYSRYRENQSAAEKAFEVLVVSAYFRYLVRPGFRATFELKAAIFMVRTAQHELQA
jgi:hypothetical protein